MSKRKTLPAVVFAAAALIVSGSVEADDWFSRTFGGKSVKGSGDMATQARDVKEFTWIETLGAFDITVAAGDQQEVVLTFDDNLVELIETKVRGKKLIISAEESYSSRHSCQVEIVVPKLEGVTTKGSGDITVEGLNSESFECHTEGSGDILVKNVTIPSIQCDINGSGDIAIDNLTADFLECRISGSGDFKADGQVERLEIDVHGSGDVDSRDLIAKEAEVDIRGSGNVRVHASESFDGAVYGSGDIFCFGNPKRFSKHVAGSGEIKRR